MLYRSTRGGESGVPFEKALLSAYAADGGLFVPESIPQIPLATLRSWSALSMSQVCARVMEHFTDLSLPELESITATAFATFNGGEEPPLPCTPVGGQHYLDTGLGPTLAFKDVGQQVVAQLLNIYLGRKGLHANICVETSGDTGPAAIAGVAGCEHVDIFVLYPHGRVSDVQELQMVTWGDTPNVHVFRTEGDTDEQAEALKLLFSDAAFMAKHRVISINSINWARVMTQSSYYFWAYLQLNPAADAPVHFVVPTGAFGNAVGGLVAKRMGLPIGRIVCATNANDVVHRTISQGDLLIAPNVMTISPAMDIQFAYNVERMLYLLSDGDTAATRRYMQAAQDRRPEPLPRHLLKAVQAVFLSAAVTDEQTCATMASVHEEHGYLLDPHSAVGVHAANLPEIKAALAGAPVACVLTAHPAKFESASKRAGVPIATHPNVERIRSKPHTFQWLRSPPPPAHKGTLKLVAWAAAIKTAVERAAEARESARSSSAAAAAEAPRARL